MEELNIEEIRLKGSTKLWWSLFAGWTTIVVTILITYGSIKGEFQTRENSDKIQDLRLNMIDAHIVTLDIQIKSLQEQINENRNKLSVLQVEINTK